MPANRERQHLVRVLLRSRRGDAGPGLSVLGGDGDARLVVRSLLEWATVRQPEQRLMLSVLEDALLLVVGRRDAAARPKLAAEARAWVASDDRTQPFSFLNLCDAVDLEAARVRSLLTPWLDDPPPGAEPAACACETPST